MMRYPLLAALLFAFVMQAVSAQDAAERALDDSGGWKTVLPPGALGTQS